MKNNNNNIEKKNTPNASQLFTYLINDVLLHWVTH